MFPGFGKTSGFLKVVIFKKIYISQGVDLAYLKRNKIATHNKNEHNDVISALTNTSIYKLKWPKREKPSDNRSFGTPYSNIEKK